MPVPISALGPPRLVVPPGGLVSSIAEDRWFIDVVDPSTGVLSAYPTESDAGAPRALASGLDAHGGYLVDSACVYWIDADADAVMMVHKSLAAPPGLGSRPPPWENPLPVPSLTSFTSRILVSLASLGASALCMHSAISTAWADKSRIVVFPGLDASAVRPDAGPISHIPPDPTPLTARMQWVFDLRWSNGAPYLVAVHPLDLGAPQTTPRAMGRFAIELFEGPTLIERVRFDFPMLGPPESDAGFFTPPSFAKKLTSRIGVMFPAVERGTRLELWDRATDTRWPLPWPVEDATRDAGTDGPLGR
jgi:hypothetical protein